MNPLLVINDDKCIPGTADHLQRLGYNYIVTEGEDTPAVQSVPTKEDRRFTAAVAALQGMAYLIGTSTDAETRKIATASAAQDAVQYADALLTELAK